MKCPNCEETLVMTERQGIEIDYCPKCRGVWLDKGELDKMLEKAITSESSDKLKQNEESGKKRYDDDKDYYHDDKDGHFNRNRQSKDKYYPNKRRGGFLGNLFDFD